MALSALGLSGLLFVQTRPPVPSTTRGCIHVPLCFASPHDGSLPTGFGPPRPQMGGRLGHKRPRAARKTARWSSRRSKSGFASTPRWSILIPVSILLLRYLVARPLSLTVIAMIGVRRVQRTHCRLLILLMRHQACLWVVMRAHPPSRPHRSVSGTCRPRAWWQFRPPIALAPPLTRF